MNVIFKSSKTIKRITFVLVVMVGYLGLSSAANASPLEANEESSKRNLVTVLQNIGSSRLCKKKCIDIK